nr:unnamed protein product [Callosobruchus analis]
MNSFVMLVLVDVDYSIMFLDLGIQGRISDGGKFKKTELHHRHGRIEFAATKSFTRLTEQTTIYVV